MWQWPISSVKSLKIFSSQKSLNFSSARLFSCLVLSKQCGEQFPHSTTISELFRCVFIAHQGALFSIVVQLVWITGCVFSLLVQVPVIGTVVQSGYTKGKVQGLPGLGSVLVMQGLPSLPWDTCLNTRDLFHV